MKFHLSFVAFATAITLAPVVADEGLLAKLSASLVLEKFKELDRNGDGKLTAEEAGNAPWFKRLDLNGDGVVTLDEVRQALAGLKRKVVSADVPAGLPAGTPEEIFKLVDKNGDGKVTPDELPKPELFKLLDTNGDGVITFEEARPLLERWVKRRASSGAGSSVAAGPVHLQQGPAILKAGDAGIGRMVQDVAFSDLSGAAHKLSDFHSAKGLAIAFTSTTCPVSKRYAPSLARLESELRAKGVALLLVNPFPSEKPEDLRADVKAHGFTSPYVHDRDGALARTLGARSTTEVLLLDPGRTLIYRGALDDQYGLNYNLDAPREQYLAAAVDAMLAGTRPEIEATAAPGCELDLPAQAASAPASPTYHRDVARILRQNCEQCHREKGIAPFALEDPDEVKDRAKVIRRVVEQGTMPPWFAAPLPGKESPWANDRSLSPRDKNDLLAWLASPDRPLGNPAEKPAPIRQASDWTIGKPDFVVQLTKPIAIKADGFMPYQTALVETTLAEDKWVQGYEIVPTAREVVHHVIVRVHPKGSVLTRRGEDGAEGYWAAYVPGNTSHVYPDGFARKLPAGATVSFQIHYTPNGKATEDHLKMGLIFAKQPPKYAMHTTAVAGRRLSIPPGAANHVVVAQEIAPFDMNVTAYMAHMHVRGKAFKFEVTYPDGKSETLLDIPHYDFNWQLRYEYREPHVIPRGSVVKITAVYDNSAGNKANPNPTKTVHWGPQTVDEMMLGYIEHYTPLTAASVTAN